MVNAHQVDGGPSSSLSEKVVKGGFWVLTLRLTNKVLGLVRIVILSRLLLPEHFGLVGIAAIVISLVETLTQPGLATALVKKEGNVGPYLGTVWTISFIRSWIIFGILYFTASGIAAFFAAPGASTIIRVFSVSVLIVGCRNPAVLYFQKELKFHKQYVYEFSITLTNLVVSTIAAVLLRNAWALVIGGIAGSSVRLLMSYWLIPYRPRFEVDRVKLVELFAFGKWVLGAGIVHFVVNQGDDVFVGKRSGVAELGFYQLAFMLSNLVTTEVSDVISQVAYPAYAKIQRDRQRLCVAYHKVLKLVAFLTVPISGCVCLLAPEVTRTVLGAKWLPAAPLAQILAWAGLLRALKNTTIPGLNAMGRPDVVTKFQLLQLVLLGAAILPLGLVYGSIGVALAVVVSQVGSTCLGLYVMKEKLECGLRPFLGALAVPVVNTGLCGVAVVAVKNARPIGSVIELGLVVLLGACLYVVGTLFFEKLVGYNVRSVLREATSAVLGKTGDRPITSS